MLFWIREARGATGRRWPTARQLGIGALTDFFDMLGIGSFAPTTSLYKLGGVVADEDIPGTLNVGHMLPTFAEAVISILVIAVEVEAKTLTPPDCGGGGRAPGWAPAWSPVGRGGGSSWGWGCCCSAPWGSWWRA